MKKKIWIGLTLCIVGIAILLFLVKSFFIPQGIDSTLLLLMAGTGVFSVGGTLLVQGMTQKQK